MALESFYGGKPGYSPTIKGTFKYISTNDTRYQELSTQDAKDAAIANHEVMNSCFQDPTYTDVWYGELCIIASDSIYNSNNGKIFRRTLKKHQSNDEYNGLYAEYLGQIVGMPGGLPKVVFTKIDDIKAKIQTIVENDIWYPTGVEAVSNFIQTSNEKRTGSNLDTSIYPYVFQNSEGIELVPGKDKNGNYNDNFEYTWLQILDNSETNSNNSESNEAMGTIDIGVKIPYLTIEPEVEPVPYTQNAEIEESNRVNGTEHPFYRKYTFSIPDGIRGIGIRNLRIATKESLGITESNNKVLDPTEDIFVIDANSRDITVQEEYYNFQSYGDNSPFWVYDLIVPKRSDQTLNSAASYICYAGDYNEIANVELGANGIFTFNRNYGNPISTTNSIKWITGTEVDTNLESEAYGKFTIDYNGNNNSEEYILPLAKRIVASNVNNNGGEKIDVYLTTTGENENNPIKKLTLQKEVVDNNDVISYEDYKLKYPTSVTVRSGNVSQNEDPEFFYLFATYNDTTTQSLGKVGLTNVQNVGYDIGVGELNSVDSDVTLYFPNEEKLLKVGSPVLIKEEINFDNLTFPLFEN